MPPTPADIIEIIGEARRIEEPSDEELWSIYSAAMQKVCRQIPRFHYNYIDASGLSQGEQARRAVTEIWEALPEKVRLYLASETELIHRARELNAGGMDFERSRFFKTMPIIESRRAFNTLYLDGAGKFLLE
jgi:hypothetical protein